MSTAYYSRELSYLQKAKNDLSLSNRCSVVQLDANLTACASIAGDSLLKFHGAWENETATYLSRKKFTNSIRVFFGDLDENSTSFRRLGILPLIIILGFTIAIGFKIWSFLKRAGIIPLKLKELPPDKIPNDIQITLIRILSYILICLIMLPIPWTFGMSARYEATRLDATLKHDSIDVDSGDFKVYNNPTFGKIWQGCSTRSLRQIYNCAQGLAPNVGIDVSDEIKDALCVAGAPNKLASDDRTLLNGLKALVDANLGDFDAVAIAQSINHDIIKLRSILLPTSAVTKRLTAKEGQAIVVTRIIPILQKFEYKPVDNDDRNNKRSVFNIAMPDMQTQVSSVLLNYWPQVNPEMYMDVIDASMKRYYDITATDFYTDYIRDGVLGVFRSSMDAIASSMKTDGRFATMEQFKRTNWPKVKLSMVATKIIVADLFTNICRYTDTFVSITQPGKSMSYELTKLYVNVALGTIVLGLLIFIVYFIFIKNVDAVTDAVSNEFTSSKSWYARMDLVKYVLVAIALAMFSMSILVVLKKKSKAMSDHNNNALFFNSQRLKAASWTLMSSIYPISCTNVEELRNGASARYDPVAYDVCKKGGNKFFEEGGAQIAGVSDDAMASSFYTGAVNVIIAYERCNLVTMNNKVPFPAAEFITLTIFLLICVGGLFTICNMTGPLQKIREIRDLLRLRERFSMLTSTVPASLASELKAKVTCVEGGADTLRILTFSVVVILFVLNAMLVMSFERSAKDYQTALDTMSADVCL